MHLYIDQFPYRLLIIILLFSACKSTEEFTGYSYDPEGVTDTIDREISEQHKRTIGFMSDGVWITNEFPGARANDIYRVDRNHYKIRIDPEISPINNSPWFGFRIWADDSVSVQVELEYTNGRQRYTPAFSSDRGESWVKADSSIYRIDPETRNGFIRLDLASEPVWVSAQEVYTTREFRQWAEEISLKPFVQQSVIGSSHQGRPVSMIKMSENSNEPVKGVILIYGRQHPPEIPGFMVGLTFLETLASETAIARQFRKYFDVWAFPMMNPDGADNGHWRTNAAGVDLNRDWQYFNQPETAAVRRTVLPLLKRGDRRVFYAIDFHSTGRNIFYPINRNIPAFPLHFTYRWAEQIQNELPGLDLGVQPFDTASPIAKNWTHKTFGVDAVTFEVWDEQPRNELESFAVRSAELFMEMMIQVFESEMMTGNEAQ
jgi:cytosolic carboxypeptidase protein 6